MYYLIENGSIRWPDAAKHGITVSEEVKDLITKLLDKNKMTRLGQKNGVDEVIQHPWFASLDVDSLLKKRLVPSFRPEIKDAADTANFDTKFTSMEAAESIIPKDVEKKIKEHKADFETF